MKKIIYKSVIIMAVICFGCQQPSGLNANEVQGTAKWVMATYLDDINKGEYEKSLLYFLNNPVASGELSMEDYIAFADNSITKQKTIKTIALSEKASTDIENTIEMNMEITYSDGSNASKWLQIQQVDGIWKLTTRGSLF